MIDMNELLFCEYSTKQKCFHIAEAAEALRMNANGIIHHYGLDFIPFAIATSYDEADALCDELLKLMKGGHRK